MAVDMTEIVGDANMQPDRKDYVIAVLRVTQQPTPVKRYLYARWCRIVGIACEPADINRVATWGEKS
jgi:hypothetical protein